MPSRNVIREFEVGGYYHIYNRGAGKMPIFIDSKDKDYFLQIISRHLDKSDTTTKSDGVAYRKYVDNLELLCYCLMGNHFHLYVYLNNDEKSVSSFMQSVLTAYTMYFNKKYKRSGTLFQGVFKSARTTSDSYLMHITRYIHMNPKQYMTYEYSSLRCYLGGAAPVWLKPRRILAMFTKGQYQQFLKDYEGEKETSEFLKAELAHY